MYDVGEYLKCDYSIGLYGLYRYSLNLKTYHSRHSNARCLQHGVPRRRLAMQLMHEISSDERQNSMHTTQRRRMLLHLLQACAGRLASVSAVSVCATATSERRGHATARPGRAGRQRRWIDARRRPLIVRCRRLTSADCYSRLVLQPAIDDVPNCVSTVPAGRTDYRVGIQYR